MSTDFTFDPGTAEALQAQIDKISDSYVDQERQIERTQEATRKLERQVRLTGSAFQQEFSKFSMQGTIGNIKDVVDLARGEINFRNIAGALELGAGALGPSFSKALTAAMPFAAVGMIYSKIMGAIVEEQLEPAKELRNKYKTLDKHIATAFEDMKPEDRAEFSGMLVRNFNNRAAGDLAEDLGAATERASIFAKAVGTAQNNAFLASAMIRAWSDMQYSGAEDGFRSKMRRTNRPDLENVHGTAKDIQNFFAYEQNHNPQEAMQLAKFVDKEISAFKRRNEENDRWLDNHPQERAEHARRMMLITAVEKRELLATQDWNQW